MKRLRYESRVRTGIVNVAQHGTSKADAVLPGGDVVWQLDCDSGPCGAVDRTVDGGLVELEGRAAHVVD